MSNAIGEILPLAVAVGLSPVPIIAVVFLLATPHARVNGPLYLAGFVAGLALIGIVLLVLADPAGANDDGEPATWVALLELALGVALLLLAVKQWRGRPHGDEQAELPRWMGSIDSFSPAKALGAGVALAAANPKNLVLSVAAAAALAETGLPGGDQAVAYAVFMLIGAAGVAAPVVIYFALGDRAGKILDDLKSWMGRYNAVIMAVLCLVIGAKLIGDGIAGL